MKLTKKTLGLALLTSAASTVVLANELPNKIVQEAKAVVPVTKTQVISTIDGQNPVRTTDTTVLDIKNKGKDIVAHDIKSIDNKAEFSKKKLAKPHVKKKSVTVPTSKIEEKKTLTQDGEVIATTKHVDATGVKFQKGQAPEKKELELGQIQEPNRGSVTRAVVSTDGTPTKDVVVLKEAN